MNDHDKQRLEFSRSRETKFPPNDIHETAIIHPTAVIGKDGFGYIRLDDGTLEKFKHTGNVIIGKDVEIGALTCIDRAAEGSTVIGEGTKIDNNTHIAHGAQIGKNCLIVAGSVIGGSAEIGDGSFIGINASIKNKVKIGKNVTVGMGAVVTKDVPDGWTVIGNPAKRLQIELSLLPKNYRFAVVNSGGVYRPAYLSRVQDLKWLYFDAKNMTKEEALDYFGGMPWSLGALWTEIDGSLFTQEIL